MGIELVAELGTWIGASAPDLVAVREPAAAVMGDRRESGAIALHAAA